MEILHNGVSPLFFINPQKLRLEFEYIIIGERKKTINTLSQKIASADY